MDLLKVSNDLIPLQLCIIPGSSHLHSVSEGLLIKSSGEYTLGHEKMHVHSTRETNVSYFKQTTNHRNWCVELCRLLITC